MLIFFLILWLYFFVLMKHKQLSINPDILAFCNGDDAVVAKIYLEWTSELYLVAYRYLRNKQDAEDVIANLFEKLLHMSLERRKKQLIDDGINLKVLLLVALKNKCLDKLKTEKNRKRILNSIHSLFDNHSRNNIWETYSNEAVEAIIAMLPEQERKIFKMKLDGFDRIETGQSMNLSVKSVSNSLSKSRIILRQIIVDFE